MYGHDFFEAPGRGAFGASEYQDGLAGARVLAARSDVDAKRIGIYGLSYGGYLTASALARDSAIFAAGADQASVNDWPKYHRLVQRTARRYAAPSAPSRWRHRR
jgi:dipeptidyl aminopeptidase/acylaminoacyl peptidase